MFRRPDRLEAGIFGTRGEAGFVAVDLRVADLGVEILEPEAKADVHAEAL